MNFTFYTIAISLVFINLACKPTTIDQIDNNIPASETNNPVANITQVTAQGTSGNYTFSVTISSPDTGCDQYADWWEVISDQGTLIYRRILAHSHVNEQPFSRSGGTVNILNDQSVWIRAHMNNGGYGGTAFYGSPSESFKAKEFPSDFANGLDEIEPLPTGCAF